MRSPVTLLKQYPKFRRVLLGESLAMAGEAAFSIALAWLVITATGSIVALAGVLLAQAIPRGTLLLLGGALTDRFSSGRVMLVCHLVRAGAMALVSIMSFTGTVQLWQLYSGVFAIGLPMLATSLSESPLALGILVSGWGAGQLLGTVAAAVTGLPQRWGLLIISMTLVEGVAFALLGQTKEPWIAAIILAVVGIGVAYSTDVALPTFIQTRTPSHLLGRVSSVLELPRVILEPVSIALLGLVLAGSLQWGFLAAAAPVLIAGAILSLDRRARTLTADGT